MKITKGNWVVVKETLPKLPRIHIAVKEPSDVDKVTFLASVHETNNKGEDKDNAKILAAAKDMYEAIVIGLTGKDLDGKIVNREEALNRLKLAKEKAEGKGK